MVKRNIAKEAIKYPGVTYKEAESMRNNVYREIMKKFNKITNTEV